MFHRIGYKTRHEVGDVEVVAINRTHEQVVANIVGYREVPPYVCRTLDEVVDPFHTTLFSVTFVHIGNYTVACPHDVDAWIQLSTQGSKISTFYIRPTLVVFSRAHDERSYIFLYLYEFFIDVVQEFGLLVSLGTFPRNVVEEYSIRADAQFIHLLELGEQVITVFLIPFDVLSRVDSPYEVYRIFLGYLYQFLDLLGFLFRIRQTPIW